MVLRTTRILLQVHKMAASTPRNALITIIGTTGTGKSKLAVDLALRFNGEIINGDAVQMYDGLPIITNKIPTLERKGVPHHLLGCIGLEEPTWSVDRFVRAALHAIGDIHSRGRTPILVGGTHYYTQSLLFHGGLMDTQSDQDDEQGLENDSSDKWPILNSSAEEMREKLREVDPVMASRWHPNDKRHIRRSLEIWLKTGQRSSDVYAEQQQQQRNDNMSHDLSPQHRDSQADEADNTFNDAAPSDITPALRFPTLLLWTHTPKEKLNERLDGRVEEMFRDGLLDEAQQLHDFAAQREAEGKPVDRSRGVYIAIGYRQFIPLIDYLRGQQLTDVGKNNTAADAATEGTTINAEQSDLQKQGIEQTQGATRRYAKAQLRWLRIKFLNALRQAGADKFMYVLDTSDPSPAAWEDKVLAPAAEYTRAFLDGERPMPDNYGVSAAVGETLTPLRDYDLAQRRDLWVERVCEVCGVTAVTEESWVSHVKGSRHKKAVKARKKKEEQSGVRDAHPQAEEEKEEEQSAGPA